MKALFWKMFIYSRWILNAFHKKGALPGQAIPDFTLSDFHGRKVNLYGHFPKKAVLLWMTNLCETCEEKIPLLEEIYAKNRDRLEILAVSILGEDRSVAERILKTHRMSFPLLLDPEDWTGKVLGFEHPQAACPMHNLLILDFSGRIHFKHHLSAVKKEKLLEALRSIGALR